MFADCSWIIVQYNNYFLVNIFLLPLLLLLIVIIIISAYLLKSSNKVQNPGQTLCFVCDDLSIVTQILYLITFLWCLYFTQAFLLH